ncbi:hypothetical protein [Fibrobacter sp. UBA3718]|uniref:hypothetical protein n=1 Tax=Fibrobacter sp. UBA3718 TaxID=1946531 RepID=UPI0025BA61AF|nr:hypothetical protein [Fibrobacter sp. UBA3718]
MDISKKKVEKNLAWSPSTQKKLASMLGVSAATVLASAALTACDTTSATSGDVIEPTSSEQMTCGEMPCDGDIRPESSSSEESPNSFGIEPTSGISSSSMAPRPLSSSYEIDSLDVTSGEVIPPEYIEPESGSNIDTGHLESSSSSSSSDAILPSSSSTESGPLAGDPVVTEPVVEPGPILAGVIEDTPVRMDEPKQ